MIFTKLFQVWLFATTYRELLKNAWPAREALKSAIEVFVSIGKAVDDERRRQRGSA